VNSESLLAEISKKSDFIFSSWNVLMIVGIGILLITGLAKQHKPMLFWIRFAFGFFAITHLLGMLHVLKQWASLEATFKGLNLGQLTAERISFAVLTPNEIWVVPFHLVFDTFVIVASWLISRQTKAV
jgi:predicted ABC-type sugar transport system permease subunit